VCFEAGQLASVRYDAARYFRAASCAREAKWNKYQYSAVDRNPAREVAMRTALVLMMILLAQVLMWTFPHS
jgi:hypothetical protein